jgi:hypothetical protein
MHSFPAAQDPAEWRREFAYASLHAWLRENAARRDVALAAVNAELLRFLADAAAKSQPLSRAWASPACVKVLVGAWRAQPEGD